MVWIVGGVDKGNDYQMLQELVVSKVKAIVCLGKDNSKIIKAFSGKIDHILEAQSAMDAVGLSYQLATKGEIVYSLRHAQVLIFLTITRIVEISLKEPLNHSKIE